MNSKVREGEYKLTLPESRRQRKAAASQKDWRTGGHKNSWCDFIAVASGRGKAQSNQPSAMSKDAKVDYNL